MQSRGRSCLPIEALWEYKVQEILPDGQEILEKPLTASENFHRIVNGIDFNDDGHGRRPSNGLSGRSGSSSIPEKTWVFLRDQIKNSLTEVCAFIDLMAVMKETKCLSLCQIAPVEQERDIDFPGCGISSQSIICFCGKKMAFASAANILLKGAERFRCRYFEMVQNEQRVNDGLKPLSYHESLMQLRKSWRLKLMQSAVLGDASLRSIGSRAKEGGNFEVFGSDASKNQSSGFGQPPDVIKVRFSSTMESLLEKDLCTGRLRVSINELNHKRPNSWQEFLERPSKKAVKICNLESPLSTSKRLCLAQNLLACREVLSTLSFEASLLGVDKSKTDIVAFSSQGKVVATVFPGFQISVSLEKLNGDLAEDGCYDHPGLSTQLKRLLFLQHMASWSNIASAPNPPTGPVQVPRRLRAAGATTTLQNSTLSNCEGVPIITACVAGFGGPAASSWMAAQNQAFQTSSLRANQVFAAPVGQERYGYFNDWAINHQQPAIDDVVPSSLTLSGLEHALRSSQASTAAISCVLGSGESLLTQLISLAKHRVLRERVSKCLTAYARTEATPGMCVLTLWHSINSPLSSSVNVTFHSAGYSSFRSRLTICVGTNSISVYGACGSSQPIIIPATADTKTHLWRILKAQEFGNQMFTLQGLASKLLGWIQLGCTAAASPSASATTPRDAVLVGSRSGNRLVCIRGGGSNSGGLELFVAKTTQDDLSSLASNGELFQTAMTLPKTLDFGSRSRLDFRQVDLSRLPGRHVVAKIESLLTCLSDA